MSAPTRPVLRWHGGKWRLAPWIISHFPPHRIYVEPYGGAASVLLRKPRSYAEVYNDLDDEVVNLFQVLRDDPQTNGYTLIDFLVHTPFSRTEFRLAYEETRDPVERARRLIVRSFMGFGSDGHNASVKTGFRSACRRSGTTPAHDWSNYPDVLEIIIKRMRGVVIENRDALEIMKQHDEKETLHYVDPPYLPETRSDKSRKSGGKYHSYRHELTTEQHGCLLEHINGLDGMVVLSGYPASLYDNALSDWKRVETKALADGARSRTEVLWLNPACVRALEAKEPQGSLFHAEGGEHG
jgi:DNA adenine methylase